MSQSSTAECASSGPITTFAPHRTEGGAETGTQFHVIPLRDQPGGAESLDVAEAPEHVPGQKMLIPLAIVSDRIGQYFVELRPGRPKVLDGWTAGRLGFFTRDTLGDGGVESPGRGHFGQIDVLIRRVRPPAGPRPALDRIGRTNTQSEQVGLPTSEGLTRRTASRSPERPASRREPVDPR